MSEAARRVGLPSKPFLYTLDQVAYLISTDEKYMKAHMIHYDGRSVGPCPKDRIRAHDISPDDTPKPEWRISERALVRYLRYKGFKYYERGYIK